MVTLPKSVKVGPYRYDIISREHMAAYDEQHGITEHLKHRIIIDPSQPKVSVADTLIHEISHVIWRVFGLEDDDKEERIVTCMATGWTQVFMDNPEIYKIIGILCNPTVPKKTKS